MIDRREDYIYVTGDIDQVIIDGGIMTKRAKPEQLRGEDICFLLEAIGARAVFTGQQGVAFDFTRKLSLAQVQTIQAACNNFHLMANWVKTSVTIPNEIYYEPSAPNFPNIGLYDWLTANDALITSAPFQVVFTRKLEKQPILNAIATMGAFTRQELDRTAYWPTSQQGSPIGTSSAVDIRGSKHFRYWFETYSYDPETQTVIQHTGGNYTGGGSVSLLVCDECQTVDVWARLRVTSNWQDAENGEQRIKDGVALISLGTHLVPTSKYIQIWSTEYSAPMNAAVAHFGLDTQPPSSNVWAYSFTVDVEQYYLVPHIDARTDPS